ncbi:11412_t:CDS:2 [Acaulospora colombiana]|uniref:11412_t:CDS:1 n=1 Tax=Acaulospora colombiana TaxID=27376 RepID=A0ACA9JYH7_9GLOM|nr:11412_t:CDS:2 [Acaulospora colombiana]
MESGELAKRLSLLEDQKNLLLANAKQNGWFCDDDDDSSVDYREETVEKLTPVNMVHAEDILVERQSLSTLEFRVYHLEKSIFGHEARSNKVLAYERLKEQLTLLKRVDEIKKEFNAIIRDGADGLKSFLEIYDQVSELISPFKDSALAMERAILTPEAKAEIICSSAEELETVAENLKQIEELKGIIDAPEFKGLDKLFPQITPIETENISQISKTNEMSTRLTSLMDRYNNTVSFSTDINTLSEIFISWDHILSTLDVNISALERAKARG